MTPGFIFRPGKIFLTLGYQHYEVSNYCLPGKASRHNLKYWQNQPYIGLGAVGRRFSGRPGLPESSAI